MYDEKIREKREEEREEKKRQWERKIELLEKELLSEGPYRDQIVIESEESKHQLTNNLEPSLKNFEEKNEEGNLISTQVEKWENETEFNNQDSLEKPWERSFSQRTDLASVEDTIITSHVSNEEKSSEKYRNSNFTSSESFKNQEEVKNVEIIEKEKNSNQLTDIETRNAAVRNQEIIDRLIKDVNHQLENTGLIKPKSFERIIEISSSCPNLAFIHRENQKVLYLLNRTLFNTLVENQKASGFRLEWQRYWFSGFDENKSNRTRKLFLLDLSGNRISDLPQDMKRVWCIKNGRKWNTFSPTKRESHGRAIKGILDTLFDGRPKTSDFHEVTRYRYEKAMKQIWTEFQTTFRRDIKLNSKNRPDIRPLKSIFNKETIDYAMIGSFWKYYHSLNRIGKNGLAKGGYNPTVEFMKKNPIKVFPLSINENIQPSKQKKGITKSDKGPKKEFLKIPKSFENDLKKTLSAIGLDINSYNPKSTNTQQKFVKEWNKHVKSNIKPTRDMWTIYNEIQISSVPPLLCIYNNTEYPYIRMKDESKEAKKLFDSTLKRYPNMKTTTLIVEWLKFRGNIEGKNPLVEVKIENPNTENQEKWFIRNKNSAWNPEGLAFKNNSAEKRFVNSDFFQEVRFQTESNQDKNKEPYSTKSAILDSLFTKNNVPTGKVFQQAYRLKIEPEIVDKFIEELWSQEKRSIKQIDETRPVLHTINEYYKGLKISESPLNIEIVEKFDIYLLDNSVSLFKPLFLELQSIVDYREEKCDELSNWWDLIRERITTEELANSLLRASHSCLIQQKPIMYRYSDATTSRFGPLLTKPNQFWREEFKNGFSGLSGALLEDPRIRESITNLTKEDNTLNPLILHKYVQSKLVGHDTVSSNRFISQPDGITQIDQTILDVFQNKKSRPVGKKKDEIKAEDYLLDWLKTVGNYDPVNFSINNFRLEFLERGESLNNLTDIASNHNAIIISYWGNSAKEIGRYMEVISSIHLNEFKRQKKQNFSKEVLQNLVIEDLKKNNHLRYELTELDSPTQSIINQLIPYAINSQGEGSFLKDSILNLLSDFGEKLFSSYHPSFTSE